MIRRNDEQKGKLEIRGLAYCAGGGIFCISPVLYIERD